MRISFFPTPAHRTFHYEPRYYDEQKEKMKERYEKYGKEYPNDKTDVQPTTSTVTKTSDTDKYVSAKDRYIPGKSIRGSFQAELEKNRKQAGNQKIKKIVVLITLVAALASAYYLAQGLVELLR